MESRTRGARLQQKTQRRLEVALWVEPSISHAEEPNLSHEMMAEFKLQWLREGIPNSKWLREEDKVREELTTVCPMDQITAL